MRIKGKRKKTGPRSLNDLYDEIEGELDHPSRTTDFLEAFKEKYKVVQLEYIEPRTKQQKHLNISIANLKSLICSWKPDPAKPKPKAIKKSANTEGKASKVIAPKNASKSARQAPTKPPKGPAKR